MGVVGCRIASWLPSMAPAHDDHAAWWTALQAGDLAYLRALLRDGADPNLRDGFGETALHRVAGDLEDEPDSDNLRIARLLLENGADVNPADSNRQTPLMVAAEFGSDEM